MPTKSGCRGSGRVHEGERGLCPVCTANGSRSRAEGLVLLELLCREGPCTCDSGVRWLGAARVPGGLKCGRPLCHPLHPKDGSDTASDERD